MLGIFRKHLPVVMQGKCLLDQYWTELAESPAHNFLLQSLLSNTMRSFL